jgi:hypothetical protein
MEPTDEHPYTESTPDPSERPSTGDNTVIVNPQVLLGCTFLMDTQEDSQRFCTCIVECISDHESNVCRSDDHVKFRISFIEKNQENDAILWQFQHIMGHQGPLLRHDKDYNGSRFNVLVEWENGEITTEPLGKPVTTTHYQDANLYHDIITG